MRLASQPAMRTFTLRCIWALLSDFNESFSGSILMVTNITVKDYLRREGAPMFRPQIMQSGLYARVKSLEPRDFVAMFGDPCRRGVGFVDRCRIMPLGRWRVVHENGGEIAIDHKVADE